MTYDFCYDIVSTKDTEQHNKTKLELIRERSDRLKQQTTKNKVKVIGTEQYINVSTGELEEMQVTTIEERDYNFTKIWMKNLILTMDIVGNQKTKFCFWLIDHLNRDNILIGTQRDMAEDCNVSLQTVSVTLKLLMDANFLRKKQSGVYIVNPDVIYKGTHAARLNVLNQYNAAERIIMTDEEKLSNIEQSIKTLQYKADKLRTKCQVNDAIPVPDPEATVS